MNWDEVFEKGLEKVRFMQNELKEKFPHITNKGKWLASAEGHWTGGFWTGLLWMNALYPVREESKIQVALDQALKLNSRAKDNRTHDMGFIFGPSCIWGYHLTKNTELKTLAMRGSANLLHLYDPQSNAVYAWDEPGYEGVSIVDTIMNLPIWVWDSAQGINQLSEKAIKVADQISANHIRKDFSTYHVVRWDNHTHKVIERTTHQGYSPESCWSRGQAWALYGFANMFRYTRHKKYLDCSIGLATYFWEHLDKDVLLPRWDFIFQNKHEEPFDSAAGCIAASGMLLLAMLLKEEKDPEYGTWEERAGKILENIVKICFYTQMDEYGIIRKVTVDRPRNSGVNESSMYGDYYFMEAVYRLLNKNNPGELEKLY